MTRPTLEERVAEIRARRFPLRCEMTERCILAQNGYNAAEISAFYESRRWGRERVGGGLPQLHRSAELTQRLAGIRGHL